MSISKVKTSQGIRYEVIIYPEGRNAGRIKRRFEKRIDAEKFYLDFKSKKQEIKTSHLPDLKTPEERSLDTELEFFLEKKSSTFTKGYWRQLQPALKEIGPLYGHYPLSRITPALMDDFVTILKRRNIKASTINRYTQVVQRIVNFSYLNDRISYNPLKLFRPLRELPVELTTWDESEVQSFLHFANNKYPAGSDQRWIFVAYLLALETGARANEIWGLQVQDVQWSGNVIQIRRQWGGKQGYVPTKGRDQRTVPMSSRLASEIRLLVGTRPNFKDPIFQTMDGTHVDHDNFSKRIFSKDLSESGSRKLRFHDLRHSAITMLVRSGVSPWVIQKVAGHKDMKTTLRYVHMAGKDVQEIGKGRCLMGESGGEIIRIFG